MTSRVIAGLMSLVVALLGVVAFFITSDPYVALFVTLVGIGGVSTALIAVDNQ